MVVPTVIGKITRSASELLGGYPDGYFARYGYKRTPWKYFFFDFKFVGFGLYIAFCWGYNYSESQRRDQFLNNLEYNRMRFYGRDFKPEMIEAARSTMEGPVGYMQVDEATGLMTAMDGTLMGPNRMEVEKRLERLQITDQMVLQAKSLRDKQRQDPRRAEEPWRPPTEERE